MNSQTEPQADYNFNASCQAIKKLLWVIATLRGPEGCPWDKEQTFLSLTKYLAEETQEVIEAVENKDDAGICEELGDVLLQVVLYSQIGVELNKFDFTKVVEGLTAKMIFRHPHVFAHRTDLELPSEMVEIWEDAKTDFGKDWQELSPKELGKWWQISKNRKK